MVVDPSELKSFSNRAYSIIESVFRSNRLLKIMSKIKLEWSNRLTVDAGRAYFYDAKIVLGYKLFKVATQEQRDNVAAHEAAHIIAFYKNLETNHGPNWREAMLKAGYKPSVFHNINCGVPVKCKCKDSFRISPARAGRLKSGKARYSCIVCHEQVSLLEPSELATC